MGLCYVCGKEVDLPHRCSYCNLTFCDEHRLPENHNCASMPSRSFVDKDSKGLVSSTSRKSMLSASKHTDKSRSQWKKTTKGWKNKNRIRSKGFRSILYKTSSILKICIKFIVFLIFSILTLAPTILYILSLLVPEAVDFINFIILLAPDALLFKYIIPNLGCFVIWIFIVYRIMQKKCKWWYYAILLGISMWNWWTLYRLIILLNFLGDIFGGVI